MSSIVALRRITLLAGFLVLIAFPLSAQNNEPEWRTWVSSDGTEIEAYLKEPGTESIVIVRRDGREFTVPLERFSEADRAYVREQMEQSQAPAEDFHSIDFLTAPAPERYQIEGVEQVRLRSGEAAESGAVRTVLNFHEISYDPSLVQRINARKPNADVVIPPSDLSAVLLGLPVESQSFVIPPLEFRPPGQQMRDLPIMNAIRKAISLDLPVIIGYRPEIQEDTPEFVGVATGYDRRTLYTIEAEGSRRPVPLDWRTLDESLLQAIIIYPAQSAEAAAATAQREPSPEFLSRISTIIRQNLNVNTLTLTEALGSQNLTSTLADINRTDLSHQLGSTRSFAREGGVPQIRALLQRGSVVIVPQEFEAGQGYALIYGDAENGFAAVEFFPNGTFNRGQITDADLARRWVTREDRLYRLDLIEIPIPPQE